MQPKKEHYRGKLPHFQQPGQWYSVTIVLKGAMPKGAMDKYSPRLETAKNRYLFLKEQAGSPGVGVSRVAIPSGQLQQLRLRKVEVPTCQSPQRLLHRPAKIPAGLRQSASQFKPA